MKYIEFIFPLLPERIERIRLDKLRLADFASLGQMIPALVMQAVLLMLFTVGYWKAGRIKTGA